MKNLNEECHVWTGAQTTLGYGVRNVNGKRRYIHRLVFCQANGIDIEEIKGKVVRHKCDNPSCINPAHLEIGTQADNMMDKKMRGRHLASPETIEKMRNAQLKRYAETPVSPESRQRMADAHKGKKHPIETRQKISQTHLRRRAVVTT